MKNKLYFSNPQIVLQEVPDEISLALSISGCGLGCNGCHSSETWVKTYGEELTDEKLQNLILKYKHISCVLIYDGMHNVVRLKELLEIIKTYKLKTAMYTGLEYLEPDVIELLDYYKLGKYNKDLGGLTSPITNQRLYKRLNNKEYKFSFELKSWIKQN